jgi:hypothetical protein
VANEADELLMGGGVRAFTFKNQGDTCRGTIVAEPKVENCYKMKQDGKGNWVRTDELDKWPSGEVKRQIALVVQTDERIDQDDDGRRVLYIHSRIQGAMRDAVKNAGAPGLRQGGIVAVRWSSGPGTPDGGPKVYDCAYQPPAIDPGSLLPASQQSPAAAAPLTAQPLSATPPVASPTAQSLGLTAPATLPPPPPGVDPERWANLPEPQRQAVLAAMGNAAATAAPF